MDLQIDYAVVPSGLIASAKTYSLIVKGDTLYGIHVGPAGNSVRTTDPVSRWAVNKVYERIARKVEEGMQRMASTDIETLAAEKDSFKCPLSKVTDGELTHWGHGFRMKFRVDGKKYKFDLSAEQKALAEQLLGQVRQKA